MVAWWSQVAASE
jgi:hypothetical protein